MSDQERIRQREHWQAIADQLGLSPDPESERPFATEPVVASTGTRPVSGPTSATVGPVEPFETHPAPKHETEPSHRVEAKPEGVQQTATVDVRPSSEDASWPEEQQPRPGRRRRTAKIPSATESSARKDVSAEGPRAEGTAAARKSKAAARRGRGRGHKRRRDEPPELNTSWNEDEPSAAGALSAEALGTEDDESKDAYNWDVPSWNELIGSLYRPER